VSRTCGDERDRCFADFVAVHGAQDCAVFALSLGQVDPHLGAGACGIPVELPAQRLVGEDAAVAGRTDTQSRTGMPV